MSKTLEITTSKIIPADIKSVFEAWLDPKALAKFIKPMPGMADSEVENAPVEGGQFTIVMKAGEQDLIHKGEYKTIDRYTTLIFTWISAHTIPDSTVTLGFKELGPQKTKVSLHHMGFPSEESRKNHQGGWELILENLGEF